MFTTIFGPGSLFHVPVTYVFRPVDSHDSLRPTLDRLLAEASGHIESSRVEYGRGRVAWTSLELRIPHDRFDDTLRAIARLGAVRQSREGSRGCARTSLAREMRRVVGVENAIRMLGFLGYSRWRWTQRKCKTSSRCCFFLARH